MTEMGEDGGDGVQPSVDPVLETGRLHSSDDLPQVLDESVLAVPLLHDLKEAETKGSALIDVVIDLNLAYGKGRRAARDQARRLVADAIRSKGSEGQRERQPSEVKDGDDVDSELEDEG